MRFFILRELRLDAIGHFFRGVLLIESFQPPLNKVFNPTYLITNPIAYHLELPKKLRTQFKGMTAMNGTNMKDALTHFIEWYVGKRPNLPQNKLLKQGAEWTNQD